MVDPSARVYNSAQFLQMSTKFRTKSILMSRLTRMIMLKSIETIKERGSIASFRIPQTEEHIDSVSYAIKTQDVKYKKL